MYLAAFYMVVVRCIAQDNSTGQIQKSLDLMSKYSADPDAC